MEKSMKRKKDKTSHMDQKKMIVSQMNQREMLIINQGWRLAIVSKVMYTSYININLLINLL